MADVSWWNGGSRVHSLVLFVDGKPAQEVKWKSTAAEREDKSRFASEHIKPAMAALAQRIVDKGIEEAGCTLRYFIEEPVEQSIGPAWTDPLFEIVKQYRQQGGTAA